MTENEFAKLIKPAPSIRPMIGPTPNGDKTLLYGFSSGDYSHNRPNLTWHTYQKNDVLHLVVYANPEGGDPSNLIVRDIEANDFRLDADVTRGEVALHVSGDKLPCQMLVPSKRLYPETCDMAFCQEMHSKGIQLPFTSYDTNRDLTKRFHGFTADQMTPMTEATPSP